MNCYVILELSDLAQTGRFDSTWKYKESSSRQNEQGSALKMEKVHEGSDQHISTMKSDPNLNKLDDSTRRPSLPIELKETDQEGRYLLTTEDTELLQEVLRHNLSTEKSDTSDKPRFRFRDLEFTRQRSTFDRQNPSFSSSQFHGFFTLFWLGVALLLVKVAANNWRAHGTIWARNEIVRLMFHKDVLVLGLTDFVLCWCTIFCLGLQRVLLRGLLHWNGLGWVVQNVSLNYFNFYILHTNDESCTRSGKRRIWLVSFGGLTTVTGLGPIPYSWCCIVLRC